MRIAVAMSGGVDSSVAAALLAQAGHDVVGFTIDIWPEQQLAPGERNCCSPEATATAQAICRQIGADHISIDSRDEFAAKVVERFTTSYAAGLTPNPCIDCNHHVKFQGIFDSLDALGADMVATGHYVRSAADPASGRWQLLGGIDPRKDQSYVLYVLTQAQLSRLVFPLGSLSKSQIRSLARRFDLPNADRPDSVDICFVAGDYRDFLRDWGADCGRPGPIMLIDGTYLGEHEGLARYTVGQRRGLGISHHQPLYVAHILPERNALILAPHDELLRTSFEIERFNAVSLAEPAIGRPATVRVRSSARHLPCRLYDVGNGRLRVAMEDPVWGVAPGQAAVFYDGPVLLGGGEIVPSPVAEVAEVGESALA